MMAAPALSAPPPPPAAAAAALPSAELIEVPLLPIVAENLRTCSAKLASGLGTKTLKAADGAKPTKDDFVLVKYIGYLATNGKVFDQNAGTAFPLRGVIPGFAEGIQLMARGGVSRLCIPAAIGYGEKSAGVIPPNSDLVFQVELIDFKTQAEVEQLNAEAARQAEAQAAAEAPAESAPPPPAPKPATKSAPPR